MTKPRALMVVHSYCPADPRVRREAEALADAGWDVDVLCLRDRGQKGSETLRGVRYLRFPIRRRRGGALRYAFEYVALLLLGFAAAIVLHGRRRYRLVQAHNMPDFLVFCGIVPWATGVPVLLDLHDPIPELYMSKFSLPRTSPLIRVLTALEALSLRFADRALVATEAFRRRLVERRRDPERLTVVLNAPDPLLFHAVDPGPRQARPAAPVVLFHGTVTERSGVDLAIRAAERVRAGGTELRLVILGDGDFLPEVRRLVGEGNRATWVDVRGPVALEKVPEVIAACDVGLVPNRGGAFSELALPTRIFEVLSMGRPVVCARSPAILDLFDESDLMFFEPESEEDLARVLALALTDPDRRERCVAAGARVTSAHAWTHERRVYLDVVESLTGAAAALRPAESGARVR
ncbi:MAG: glycosyltransferase family 4 protein [bacterium]